MAPEIVPRARKWPAAASANQERMFGASLTAGGHPQIFGVWSIEGPLDADALRRAWTDVLARHAVLSAPLARQGERLCALAPDVSAGQGEIRAERDASVRSSGWARAWLAAEVADYRAGALAAPGRVLPRLSIATDGNGHHCLLLSVDHLVSDGRSMSVLARDLSRAYAGQTPGPASVDYYDWVLWDRRRRESAGYRQALDSWREVLTAPGQTAYPLLAAGTPSSVAPAVATSWHDGGDVARLRRRARSAGTTPFVLALEALAHTTYEMCGTGPRVVITSFHNRTQPGLLSLVGYFAHNGLVAVPAMTETDLGERIGLLSESVMWSVRHSLGTHREVRRYLWPGVPDQERFPREKEVFLTYNPSWGAALTLPGAAAAARTGWLPESIAYNDFYVNGLNLWLEEEEDRLRLTAIYRADVIGEPAVRELAEGMTARLGA